MAHSVPLRGQRLLVRRVWVFALAVMRTVIPVAIYLLVCGCSEHQPSQQADTRPKSFTFVDGSVMQVQKQDGVLLEGIHLVQKTPDGVQTCDAQKGQMIEDAEHHVVHVTLYDASVVLPSKQQMTVDELKIGLAK